MVMTQKNKQEKNLKPLNPPRNSGVWDHRLCKCKNELNSIDDDGGFFEEYQGSKGEPIPHCILP